MNDAQRKARDKWDSANMAYQTVKVSKALLESFREACKARGDKVNTVLRHAMEAYVRESELLTTENEETGEE